jgi:hypothetical protein
VVCLRVRLNVPLFAMNVPLLATNVPLFATNAPLFTTNVPLFPTNVALVLYDSLLVLYCCLVPGRSRVRSNGVLYPILQSQVFAGRSSVSNQLHRVLSREVIALIKGKCSTTVSTVGSTIVTMASQCTVPSTTLLL